MNKEKFIVPSTEDWGEISNLDIAYAFEYFGGKTNEQMHMEFKKNVIERTENLRRMPLSVFRYYIVGFSEYIKSGDFDDFNKPDSVSCFFNLIYDFIEKYGSQQYLLYNELRPLLVDIATNQASYEADENIYGCFSDQLREIDCMVNKNQ
jgi:hypothetical protein